MKWCGEGSMKGKAGFLAKRDGAALVVVLVVFVVLMILFGSITSLFSRNLVQAKVQERKTQAYYLALSGLDLATAALLQESNPAPGYDTLIEKVLNDTTDPAYGNYVSQTLSLDGGTVDLRMRRYTDAGTDWVIVESIGTLSSGTSSKLTQRILGSNSKVIQRIDSAP